MEGVPRQQFVDALERKHPYDCPIESSDKKITTRSIKKYRFQGQWYGEIETIPCNEDGDNRSILGPA
jgi:hypothetical protein